MKIFDFSNGTKGAQLGETKLFDHSAGWMVQKGDKMFKVTLANSPNGFEWTSGASQQIGREMREIRPEDYGVEAICFCAGEIKCGEITFWEWKVIGTADWNRQACKSGILKSEFIRNIEAA